MDKIPCNIVKDILPLYYDHVCSDESKKMIEEHLAGCSSCKGELARIQAEIKIPLATVEKNCSDGNVIKDMATLWERSKVRAFVKGLIIASVVFIVIFLALYVKIAVV